MKLREAGAAVRRAQQSRYVKALRKPRGFLAGSWLEYAIVAVIFFVATLMFTDFVLLQGGHQLFIEGPGDGTAGFLWFNFADHDMSPLLGHTDMINYPVGDDIANPVYVTYSVHLFVLWFLTKFVGPIMAINLWTFVGFFSGAMAMYWLIKKLTHNTYAALFAGFAAAYVPYHIMNSTSHLPYIFSALFTLLFAAVYGFWKRPTIRRAVIIAVVMAVSYYTDGYFILISTVELLALVLSFAAYDLLIVRRKLKYLWQRLKTGVVAAGVLMALALPIGYVQVVQAKTIASNFSNARTEIKSEMDLYSAKMMDFIIPSVHNPFLIDNPDFQQVQKYKNSRSNAMENSMYIGFTVLILCVVSVVLSLVFLFRPKQSSVRRVLKREPAGRMAFVAITGVVTAIALFAWMLPRSFHLLGISMPTPAGLLADSGVALWRVLSRFFLPFHVILVIVAAIGFNYITSLVRGFPKNAKGITAALFIAIIALTGAEYASLTSRPPYDFQNLPKAYYWLKDQQDIQVVAELPLIDRPLEATYNYVTAQLIHGKKLINNHLLSSPIGSRNALGDADNSETIDYAAERGAQAVVTHNRPCSSDLSWGALVYKDDNTGKSKESAYYGSPICIYKLNAPRNTPDDTFPVLERGTFSDAPLPINGTEYNQVYGSRGVITAADAYGKKVSGVALFTAATHVSPSISIRGGGTWSVVQNGEVLKTGAVGESIEASVKLDEPIEVMVLWNNPEYKDTLYALSLSQIKLTRY